MKNIKNNKASLPLDTPKGPAYDTPFLSPSGLTGGSTRKQCHMDSRFRGNDRGECGHSGTLPLSSSDNSTLSPSDTPFLSSSDLLGGSTKQQCRLDTPVKPEYDRKEVNCHSGLRAGIQGNDNLMPKAFRISECGRFPLSVSLGRSETKTRGSIITESGRSMVEILGTLAIIGVLSIGGIAGYSYGMDKYRASTIINDVNLRVVDLIAQVNRGSDLSLSEWPTTTANNYSIGLETNGATTSGGILVAGVKQSVCEMLADDLLPEGVKLQIDGTDYVSGTCGESNNMTFYYDAVVGTAQNGGGETTGEQCGSTVCGTCQKCDSSTESCVTVADYETKCTVDGQSGWCVSGTCQPDTTCNCEAGQYCTDTNESCEQATPSGTCKDVASQFKEETIDGITYYISNSTMSWWNAASACEVLGKSLPSVSDLVTGWSSGSGAYTKTSLGEALYSKMGSKRVWSSISACNTYYVSLDNGGVSSYLRHGSFFYAVCK